MVALVLLLAGCAHAPGDAGSSGFPAETAEDWATYGDYLLELRAVRQVTLDPDQEERSLGEGLYRRQFTLVVERELWRRPGVRYAAPEEERMVSGGWQFENGDLRRRRPLRDPDQLVVGTRYVGVFTHDGQGAAEGGDGWWCFALLPVRGDGTIGRRHRDGADPVLGQLRGLTPQQAGALLGRTRPDPAVVPYLDRDALDRYQLSRAPEPAGAGPAPGER